ncbi:putative dehydrogenase [Silvibacterium bohemicum]|uniref:Putative dehydrogenase n=1 Tax=Silvibacterium bohemicum TaxID=1577686 RepID=A0A841JV51_9BACT|nr:Gfo/Idh/MocA family oxidoreductase [Silvibacterium bohemicum]MBB6145216.1 putative dehydrogenase [Silvibacterium bohemicum]
MTEAVRVGIVGARFAARFHWDGLRRVYGLPVEIVGVTSKTPEARDAFARETGIRAFESFAELCSAVDVVDICTPPSSHEQLAIEALQAGKHVIIEKPLTGYYGAGADGFHGSAFSKEQMLREATASCARILAAAKASGKRVCYAENWVYAPAIQKEAEILAKSSGQILWMLGEQSHSGSHSPYYGSWKFSGGGSLVGKGCHPLSAALYLKRIEGQSRNGAPIRPATVSARTHEITRMPGYRDEGFLRTAYDDTEDYAQIHIKFADGTVADIFSSELVIGGVHNWMEIICNNHRTRCNLNPIDALETFNPKEEIFKDIYITEKLGSKQGWSNPAPDEAWQHGYPQEFQDFMESIFHGREPLSGIELACDAIATIYAGYLSAERGGAEVEVPL